jgi:5-methylthioribose kinase
MPAGYQRNYMRRVLQDSTRLGACKMMRRVIGLAGVEDIRGIADVHERAIAGSLGLNIGQALIMNREQILTIEELVEVATGCQPTYPWKG